MTPGRPAFEPIEDGDVLPMLGGLRVIPATRRAACASTARDKVLFVGDTLQRRFGRVSYASGLYSDDLRAARSVKRLAELDVETVVFSHFAALEEGAAESSPAGEPRRLTALQPEPGGRAWRPLSTWSAQGRSASTAGRR